MTFQNHLSNFKELRLTTGAKTGIVIFYSILLCLLITPYAGTEVFIWWVMLICGYIFLNSMKAGDAYNKPDLQLIYVVAASCFGFFTLYTHSYIVKDPSTDTFIATDSFTYHKIALDVAKNSWTQLIPFVLSKFYYSDFYLFSFILGALYKIDYTFGGQNPVLLVKLFHSTIGALTIGITYVTASFVCKRLRVSSFLWFILFSPILENTAVLIRDIYICFFYIWIFYYVINPKVKYRTLYLILLSLATMLIRPENGLFALGFICLRYIDLLNRLSKTKKTLMILFILVLGVLAIRYILPTAQDVLQGYQERDLSLASEGSFGAILKSLPIPFNFILPAIFSQIMPFPFWFPLTRPFGGELCFPSIFDSFYWIAIWSVIFYSLKSKFRIILKRDNLLIYSLTFSVLYIIMTSYGEINVRRIMGVYPIIFVIYLALSKYVKFSNRLKLDRFSAGALLCLNLVYLLIK